MKQFCLMQFRPGFDQSLLACGECPCDLRDRLDAIDADLVLIVRVETGKMMRSPDFHVHTNDDPKKSADLGHETLPVGAD